MPLVRNALHDDTMLGELIEALLEVWEALDISAKTEGKLSEAI